MGEMRGEISYQRRYFITLSDLKKINYHNDSAHLTVLLPLTYINLLQASCINFTGFCPIFTNKGFIDWKPCNISIPTCPNISYVSDEVYKCKCIIIYQNDNLICGIIYVMFVVIFKSLFSIFLDSHCFGKNSLHKQR